MLRGWEPRAGRVLGTAQQICGRVGDPRAGAGGGAGEVATLLSQGTQTVLRTDDPIRTEMVLRGSD